MFAKKLLAASFSLISVAATASVETANIHPDDLKNPEFVCLDPVTTKYSAKEQKLVDTLWQESLVYLRNYADALTTSTNGDCLNSDVAIYETTAPGFSKMCIMEKEDMKKMVKHIYQIVNNPDAAKKCFDPRKGDKSLTMPTGTLLSKSPVAKWLDRTTMTEFFNRVKTTKKAREHGKLFAKNFSKMATGSDIVMPKNFKQDVSANALPNLWASVGWSPMYAANSDRNKRNFDDIRGGYAYAEVLGHWGLLRIDTINKEKVGAEVGMVVQQVDTFYPYHNHAISEAYYTIRQPACANQFKSFAVREGNSLLKTIAKDQKQHEVELDTNFHNEQTA